MPNKNKIKFLFICFFIISINAFGQTNEIGSNTSSILIRNGKELNAVTIEKIETWGITIRDSNLYINYKVISKIKTDSKDVIYAINNLVDSLVIDSLHAGYVIDFSNAKVKFKPQISEKKILNNASLYFTFLTNKYESTEFDIVASPIFLPDNLFIKLSGTFDVLGNDDGYSITGFFAGFGFSMNTEFAALLGSINFGQKFINYPYAKQISKETMEGSANVTIFYPELLVKVNLDKSKRFFVTVGARFFTNNVKIKGDVENFGAGFGFGINL